jgi:DNA-binding NarL/FixJ family response regulator
MLAADDPPPVRVLVVDDEPMVCTFLRTILTSTGRIVVDAVAHDGAAAVDQAVRNRPDVVLMDLRMPGADGVAATTAIRRLPDPPVVVVMTTLDPDEQLAAALEAGAIGYLSKTTPPESLIPLVLAAAAGVSVLSPDALDRLKQRPVVTSPPIDPAIATLSRREREVLNLLAEGLSNPEIGRKLYLSESTVKGHVSHLMKHLNCRNRTQLALRVRGQ